MRSEYDRAVIRKNLLKFKESVQKFAGLLSSKDVKVTFRGSECRTDGKNIILPAVDLLESADATDEEIDGFISALVGLVDHEVGHVLFTNTKLWQARSKHMLPQVRELSNAVEDGFVERKMRELWKGSGWSIEYKNNYLVKEHQKEYRTLPAFTQISQLVCLLTKGASFRHVTKFFDPEIARWVDQHLDKEIAAAGRVRCTRDSIRLANRIYEKVKKAFKDPPQNQGKDQGDQDGEESQGDKRDANSSEGDDSARAEREESASINDEEGGTTEDESVDGEPGGVGDEEESNSSDDAEAVEGSLQGKDDGSVEDKDYEVEGDDQKLANSFKKFYDKTPDCDETDSVYTPYTVEGDCTGLMQRETDEDWGWINIYRRQIPNTTLSSLAFRYGYNVNKVLDIFLGPRDCAERLVKSEALASDLAGPLKVALARVLKAKGTAYTVRDLDHGHLDRRRLHRLPVYKTTGINPRVYRDEVCDETYNLAVLLCINESGSMTSFVSDDAKCTTTRMDIAIAAGLALGDVLHALNIPFGVLGHTTGSYDIGAARYGAATYEDRKKFSRFGDLKIEWVKGFKDLWLRRRSMMGGLYFQVNTYDAEVVRYGARSLCSLQGVHRRIMIMLDDGEPHPNMPEHIVRHERELKVAVKEVMAAGIEVVGVGMASSSVATYYPDHVVVTDLKTLPVVLLDKLGQMLGVNRLKRAM
jgi:cobalamin biosynthesis protein CobT